MLLGQQHNPNWMWLWELGPKCCSLPQPKLIKHNNGIIPEVMHRDQSNIINYSKFPNPGICISWYKRPKMLRIILIPGSRCGGKIIMVQTISTSHAPPLRIQMVFLYGANGSVNRVDNKLNIPKCSNCHLKFTGIRTLINKFRLNKLLPYRPNMRGIVLSP